MDEQNYSQPTADVQVDQNYQNYAENGSVESSVTNENGSANTNTSVTSKNSTTSLQGANNANQQVVASGASENDGVGYVLVEDEYGKRTLKAVKQESEPQSQPQNEPQPQGQYQVPQGLTNSVDQGNQNIYGEPEVYDLNEFTEALATNNVDERRVPQEYQQQYANFKINQAMQEYTKRQQQQEQAVAQQLNPENKQEQMNNFFSALNQEAEKRAAASVGLTEEDVANLEYMDETDEKYINYQTAKEWHKQELMQGLQQRANQENAQRQYYENVMNGVNQFVNQARASEPNFDAINKILEVRYQTLPLNIAKPIEEAVVALKQGALNDKQAALLQKYYENTRREYYAKRNGLSAKPQAVPRPPIVERAGNGQGVQTPAYKPDYKQLRNASMQERRAWLKGFLSNNNQ